MNSPRVSVIIPTFNHATYLPEALQCVLGQTYASFEIIVVNDGSTDATAEVVKQFDDPRIRYIEQDNRGATSARNTGIRASCGELIALLDADDLWHPEKLQLHADFLLQHPEVGVSYNTRFELNHSARTIRDLWRPPDRVTLSDLVLGFPFSPSDMVLRRAWAFQAGLFDESYLFYGDDLDFFCRLAMAGCQFARVDRALNYRRRHAGRIIKNLEASVESALRPLGTTFSDPRCPARVFALHDLAYAAHTLVWAALALAQNETALGQRLLREAARLNPAIISGNPCEVTRELLHHSLYDESTDHAKLLPHLFGQFPEELAHLRPQCKWAVGRGYLERATRAIIWDRLDEGASHFAQARELGVQIDEDFLNTLTFRLMSYEAEFGTAAVSSVLRNVMAGLVKTGNRVGGKRLRGSFSASQAFRHYALGRHDKTLRFALQAAFNNPAYVANRGIISILLRSIPGAFRERFPNSLNRNHKVQLTRHPDRSCFEFSSHCSQQELRSCDSDLGVTHEG